VKIINKTSPSSFTLRNITNLIKVKGYLLMGVNL
jgi:hypothetical protein